MKKYLIAAALLLALSGCTDAELSSWGALGEEATVTCYSGGVAVFEDSSTGKVIYTESGVVYKSKSTGRYIKTYADCVVVSK